MHDKNGNPLAVGDRITIEAEVIRCDPGEEFCNVQVRTIEPMYPSDRRDTITLNTRQLVKVLPLVLLAIAISGGQACGQVLLEPAEDAQRLATILVTSTEWQQSPAEKSLVEAFATDPRLGVYRERTHFFHFTPTDKLWQERYAPTHDGRLPALWIQDYTGAVFYKAVGPAIPADVDELVADLASNTRLIAKIRPHCDPPNNDAARGPKRPLLPNGPLSIVPESGFVFRRFKPMLNQGLTWAALAAAAYLLLKKPPA